MSIFQIVQMDPAAAKWLGFAKQQCKRLIDNGTKDFYREWTLEGMTVKAKSYGGTVKLWLVAGGVTDFVGVAMPNPVPYRGVSIGVVDKGVPSVQIVSSVVVAPPDTTETRVWTTKGVDGAISSTGSGTYVNTAASGDNAPHITYSAYFMTDVEAVQWVSNVRQNPGLSSTPYPPVGVKWVLMSGDIVFSDIGVWGHFWVTSSQSISWATVTPSYETLFDSGEGGVRTYVMASDGTVLASEVQTTSGWHTYYVPDTTWNGEGYCNMYVDSIASPVDHRLNFSVPEDCIYPEPTGPAPTAKVTNIVSVPDPNGSRYTWTTELYDKDGGLVASIAGSRFSGGTHPDMSFYVELYGYVSGVPANPLGAYFGPPPSAPTPIPAWQDYSGTYGQYLSGGTFDTGTWSAVTPSYESLAGQPSSSVAAFKARRKAWFLKNSTEFIAALKGKFQPGAEGVTRAELQTGMLPASWDNQIKRRISADYTRYVLSDGNFPGRHTKMPIIMGVTYTDTVLSDTSAGMTQAGTRVRQRAATFQYVDADGVSHTETVNGTLTQVVTQHTQGGVDIALSRHDTYTNWYEVSPPTGGSESQHARQFFRDRSYQGLAQLWSGVEQTGCNANSAEGTVGNPLTYVTYSPAYPAYSNTLAGTAAALYLQYHNTVLPEYVADSAQSSTVMNNSAMYNVKQIKLRILGPVKNGIPLGIFADAADADGATQMAYYGEASCSFDWATGAISLTKWNPKQDDAGNDAPAIIDTPAGYSYVDYGGVLYFTSDWDGVPAYNCAIGYGWGSTGRMWPDVAEYLKLKTADLKSGVGDQILYTIMRA